jgi:leader peptidase (prepilin peptidase)/N-methyltransferase
MMSIIAVTLLTALLIWVAVHDIRTHKIENFVHPIIMVARFFVNNLGLSERIAGALFCFVPLFIANLISKNGIGMGDVKLIGAFGFVLGVYGGLTAAVSGLTLMVLTFGVYQKVKKSKARAAERRASPDGRQLDEINEPIPLAPFLCGGFVLTYFAQLLF